MKSILKTSMGKYRKPSTMSGGEGAVDEIREGCLTAADGLSESIPLEKSC